MMTNDLRGFSVRIAREMAALDKTTPVGGLAVLCLQYLIPVSTVAEDLGVTKPTVYSWFTMSSSPSKAWQKRIAKYVAEWQEHVAM